ncbi:hypothetical protein C5167_041149 [Papaver somniferum]|uniref:S-protein homolog n=1 Tax=Papaver somniferum TaxID=3469 RepID=A0A4Y7IH37_PAPSO|nr:S-protein homolog 29-like [Papaver somniferum]RZC48194.1 hypothetical protein C5167_041149 [Papaver somniferum]
MSKSFFGFGSLSAIFFTLLALSLFVAKSVVGEGIHINKKTVTVTNDIDPGIALTIHCWSSDDDFGFHTLYYRQNFLWRFKVNLFRSTKFVCDSSWYDPNEKRNHAMRFTAYKAARDWRIHCKNDCKWSIARDGGYYGGGTDEFPQEKIFSYP